MKFLSSEPVYSGIFFMLLVCWVGPSFEKFFIVSVNDNSVNKSDTLSEGKKSYCLLTCVNGGFHRNWNNEQ